MHYLQNNIIYIDNQAKLADACRNIERYNVIGLDTEFKRHDTYYPKLCLIQISLPDNTIYLIDTLAKNINKALIFAILNNKNTIKIIHDAYQDHEAVQHHFQCDMCSIFDTKIATMLCSENKKIGYADTIKYYLNINITKQNIFKGWDKRPLNQNYIDYAANDVMHLHKLYTTLTEILTKKDKMAWMNEEMQRCAATRAKNNNKNTDNMIQKVMPPNGTPFNLRALKLITLWRENKARKLDIPCSFILSKETITQIACAANLKKAITLYISNKYFATELIKKCTPLEQSAPHIIYNNCDYRILQQNTHLIKKIVHKLSLQYEISEQLLFTGRDIKSYLIDSKFIINTEWRRSLLEPHILQYKGSAEIHQKKTL